MLSKLMGWIDYRFPLTAMYNDHMAKYPAPKNLNFWYFLDPWRCWCWSTRSSPASG